MPVTYRFTMGFRQLGRTATETYYQSASSLSNAALQAQQLLDARNKMLFNTTEWIGIRIGDVDVPRSAQLFEPGEYTTASDGLQLNVPARGLLPVAAWGEGADQPNSCLQVMLRYQNERHTTRYVAFVPDAVLAGDPDSVKPGKNTAWNTGYLELKALLVGGKWKIKARKISGVFAEKPILEWKASNAQPAYMGIVINKAGAPALAKGDKVSIKGTRRRGFDKTSYNGIYVVKEVVAPTTGDEQTIYLDGTELGVPASIKTVGKYQKVDYEYPDIAAWGWWAAGTHKRGGSFGQHRGRRLKRVSLGG